LKKHEWWSHLTYSDTKSVTANENTLNAKNPVVSEFVYIKFTLVPDGVRMESNAGDGSVEQSASFARLLFQLTEGKQNLNIGKHIEITVKDEAVKKHIFDIWQTLKLLDLKQKTQEEDKTKPVIRASQVLQHSKGI